MFGMSGKQTQEAATVMEAIGEEWRALVAGREGFLVGRKRAGLLRHAVVWGEMDRMVCLSSSGIIFGLWRLHLRTMADFKWDSRSMLIMLCIYDMQNRRESIGPTITRYILTLRMVRSGWTQ